MYVYVHDVYQRYAAASSLSTCMLCCVRIVFILFRPGVCPRDSFSFCVPRRPGRPHALVSLLFLSLPSHSIIVRAACVRAACVLFASCSACIRSLAVAALDQTHVSPTHLASRRYTCSLTDRITARDQH